MCLARQQSMQQNGQMVLELFPPSALRLTVRRNPHAQHVVSHLERPRLRDAQRFSARARIAGKLLSNRPLCAIQR